MSLTLPTTYTKSGTPARDLSRFAELCGKLGDPQNKLRFVHVAGTNGKGSVCEYITRALLAWGKSTGTFASPYVREINERIRVNGSPVTDETFLHAFNAADKAAQSCNHTGFSQFEILTAAAFLIFAEHKAEYVVLETGIGGRLDCTNIIPAGSCLAAVITSIGYDHCELLGSTLAEIAANKAGIIKFRRPAVCAWIEDESARAVIEAECTVKQTTLTLPKNPAAIRIIRADVTGNEFVYSGEAYATAMCGRHQIQNAVTAAQTLKILGVPVDCVKQGLKNAVLPARAQVIRTNPLLIVDGAHNEQGLIAAAELLKDRKGIVVAGMTVGKDYVRAIKALSSAVNAFVFTDGFLDNKANSSPRAVDKNTLAVEAQQNGYSHEHIYTIGDPMEALRFAEGLGYGAVLVTGSLYLAGYILNGLDREIL
jgi:dihydrofolate synthase/folylpolyglutamate synthase